MYFVHCISFLHSKKVLLCSHRSGSSCFWGSEAPRLEAERAWGSLSIKGLCLASTRCRTVVSVPLRGTAVWSPWVARPKHMVSSCYKCPVLQIIQDPRNLFRAHISLYEKLISNDHVHCRPESPLKMFCFA